MTDFVTDNGLYFHTNMSFEDGYPHFDYIHVFRDAGQTYVESNNTSKTIASLDTIQSIAKKINIPFYEVSRLERYIQQCIHG